MGTKILDLREFQCPEPLKRTQAELELIKEGVVIVLVKSPANWNIERLARRLGLRVEGLKHKGYYELKIIKTPHSKPKKESILIRIMKSVMREESERGLREDMMLVVSTDVLGRQEDIGKALMKALFETMKVMDDMPACIFFMNTGVKLTTTNDEIIPLLKDFERNGIDIYSCSSCLKHFNVEDRLQVGQAGGMAVLTEGMRTFKKIVTI